MATIYDLELKFLLREEVDLELLVSMVGESLKLSGCEVSIFLGDFLLSDFEVFNRNVCDRLVPFLGVNWAGGCLRVGVFYDLSESIVFPMKYGLELMRLLVSMNLSIECVGYPCDG
jgi:hypothetical protein